MKRRVKAAVIQLVVFAAPVPLSRDLHWIRHTGRLPLVRTEGAEDMSFMFIASPFLLLGGMAWSHFRSREPRQMASRILAGGKNLNLAINRLRQAQQP